MSARFAHQPSISARDLRAFGLLIGISFGAMLGVIVPLARGRHLQLWPWTVALLCWVISILRPESLRRFHAAWMALGHALGAIQSRIVLGIVFFLVVTPFGWLVRLTRKRRRFEPDAPTYRLPSKPRPAKGMERPF